MNEVTPEPVTKEPKKFEFDMSENGKAYFKELTEKAVLYKSEVAKAKTELKKNYYNKKLLKINKKIYAILGMSLRPKNS